MLKLVRKDNKGIARWLVDARMRIGSAPDNDFVIADASVADTHAELRIKDEEVALVRVHSDSVLSVNGRDVKKAVLTKAGDLICVGTVELELVDPKEGFVPKIKPVTQDTPWSIKAMDASLPEKTFAISNSMVIGRSSDCQISISSSHLSRRHAELSVVDGRLMVKDMGSSNGTYVNGKRVTEAFLKRGDLLGFDKLIFTVLGPPDELDKTMVRTMADSLPVDKRGESASGPSASMPTPSEAAASEGGDEPASGAPVSPQPATAGGSGMGMIVAVAVVLVLAGVGLFMVL
ncbi:FHA domain-containing protein [Aestuariirhabdus litorea]|uniref:FHA domain-containing protein n=1 Tax=Aestuariirhabdus litorea TaxID=2528527 RepID=A0A3P3VQH9_9GAMM|nr:FHA domain-containing protein [Aestuariirhabdus litorea]RRJ83906.1 FHA domain-containing protein [Aestuariirhabdus litorea]RWW97129.1 FHA domain-containing protein [Endozoicomonadaceae bacterium GTF-13]